MVSYIFFKARRFETNNTYGDETNILIRESRVTFDSHKRAFLLQSMFLNVVSGNTAAIAKSKKRAKENEKLETNQINGYR